MVVTYEARLAKADFVAKKGTLVYAGALCALFTSKQAVKMSIKMFKKITAFLLTVSVFAYSCPLVAFAQTDMGETEDLVLQGYIGAGQESFYAQAHEELGLASQREVSLQVEEDFALLQGLFQPMQYVTGVEVGENALRYTMLVPEWGVQTKLEAYETANGARVLEVWEGALHDTLVIMPDGTIMLNGGRVTITEIFEPASMFERSALEEELELTPAAVSATWVSAFASVPLAGTAGQYNTPLGTTSKVVNSERNALIKELALGTIATLIVWAITFSGGYAPAPLIELIASTVAANLKTAIEAYAPNTTSFSFKQYRFQNNTHSSVVAKYYRSSVDYYYTSNYTGTPITRVFYESYVLV